MVNVMINFISSFWKKKMKWQPVAAGMRFSVFFQDESASLRAMYSDGDEEEISYAYPDIR